MALTTAKKLKILGYFYPLCGESKALEKILIKAGFGAFYVLQKSQESFCPSKNISHYLYIQEQAKEIISSYRNAPAKIDSSASGYKSLYLEQLSQQRDKITDTSPDPWNLILDPCLQNRMKLRLENPQRFDADQKKIRRKLTQLKQKEAGNLTATNLKSKTMNELLMQHLFSYFKGKPVKEIMGKHLEPLGFLFDKKRSSDKYPVFTKTFSNSLDLCCGIASYKDVHTELSSGSIELIFHLRDKSFNQAKVEVSPYVTLNNEDLFLIIRTQDIIPYFLPSYMHFSSTEELYLNIKAQVKMFEVIFDIVSDKVRENINKP